MMLRLLVNKYFLVLMLFFVWMVFFEENSFRRQWQLSQELDQLESQKVYYETEIEKNLQTLHELQKDTAAMIRYAREHYFMKKDNEDIYIIIQDSIRFE